MTQSTAKRSTNPQAFLFSLIKAHPDQLKLLLIGWYCLLALLTFLGSGSLLSESLHPLYLVITLVFIPFLFLLLTLCRFQSFLARLFLALLTLLPFRSSTSKEKEEGENKQNGGNLTIVAKSEQYRLYLTLLGFIAHSSWLIIFLSLIILLSLKFSLQHFDFYLSSTLFSNDNALYQRLFSLINWLPNILSMNPIDSSLITDTLNQSLTDSHRALWARWILMIVTLYGLLPRLILSITSYIKVRREWRASMIATPRIQRSAPTHRVEKPVVEREKVKKSRGSGQYIVAIDCLASPQLSQYQPSYLNSLDEYNQFYDARKKNPAKLLIIFIDANQTPDRGVLRRLTRLMNYSEQSELYAIPLQSNQPNRFEEWQRRLIPLLSENESLHSSLNNLPADQSMIFK